jgi:GNAT superfamily N-acetyltransferase
LEIVRLSGEDLAAALPDLARLRIEIFRAFPYLYDGTEAYERDYLSGFASAQDAIIVAARVDGRLVGCATGSALTGHHDAFAEPLAQAGLDVATTFYCAESVLEPAYRGRGVGHDFFDQREAHAKALGYKRACFCAVIRPTNHPLRPSDYSPLDAFWRARGYAPLPGAVASYTWKDVDVGFETAKPMQVWVRTF